MESGGNLFIRSKIKGLICIIIIKSMYINLNMLPYQVFRIKKTEIVDVVFVM